MTDFETHPAGTADLVKRLRQRADQNRAIQKNNEAVASALMGQRLLFDQGIRSDANTFAVSLWLDYEICAKKDAKLSQDWGDAADRIEQLEAELARANAATAAAYDVAARRVEREGHSLGGEIRALATPDQTAALDKLIAEAVKPYAEALAWYGEQSRLARLIHSEGDAGRNALQADGGKRADAILAASKKGGV